jgi:hypothetical protein
MVYFRDATLFRVSALEFLGKAGNDMPGTLPLVFAADCSLTMARMGAALVAAGPAVPATAPNLADPGFLRRAGALRAGPDHG